MLLNTKRLISIIYIYESYNCLHLAMVFEGGLSGEKKFKWILMRILKKTKRFFIDFSIHRRLSFWVYSIESIHTLITILDEPVCMCMPNKCLKNKWNHNDTKKTAIRSESHFVIKLWFHVRMREKNGFLLLLISFSLPWLFCCFLI